MPSKKRWFIPVNVVLASAFGSLLDYLVAFLVKPRPEFFNFTVGSAIVYTYVFSMLALPERPKELDA